MSVSAGRLPLCATDWGYIAARELPNGMLAGVMPFMFTWGLCVGIGEHGYDYRYCYPNMIEALLALVNWSGEGDPPGPWIVQKGTSVQRRNPARLAGIPIVEEKP